MLKTDKQPLIDLRPRDLSKIISVNKQRKKQRTEEKLLKKGHV